MVNQAAVGCCLIVVAVPLLLVCLCFGAIDQNEYGLVYNWVTKGVSQRVYHGGRHFIGFWNSFITFPATVQTIEFSDRVGQRTAEKLHTRTKEGLGLHLSISFQYKLDPARIPELFTLTNTMYQGLFTRIARDQMLEAASEYEGPQYWQQRRQIGDHMRKLVDGKMKESCASLWGLQILVIDLPERYEKSITMTQVQQQIIQTRRNEQVAASIRADTDVLKAEIQRDITVVQADAQANYTLRTRLAAAEASRRKISAEAHALGYVRSKLGLSAKAAVEYQELAAYGNLANASFLANLQGAMPTFSVGSAAQPPAAAPPANMLQRRSPSRQSPLAPDLGGTPAPGRDNNGTSGDRIEEAERDIQSFFLRGGGGNAAAPAA